MPTTKKPSATRTRKPATAKTRATKAKTPAKKAPAKKTTKTEIVTEKSIAQLKLNILNKTVFAAEQKFDVVANSIVKRNRFSTGILALDLQWGGGMIPGVYTLAAPEKAGKSTTIATIFGNMIRAQLPICHMRDAEGTAGADIEYFQNLLGSDISIQEIIAQSDSLDIHNPRLHLESNIQRTFGFIKYLLRTVPDKVYAKKFDSFVFRAPDTKLGKLQMSMVQGDIIKQDGFLYALTDDTPIGFMAIDSYASMLTDDQEENEEQSGQAAQQASAFSENFKLIISPLRTKGIIVLGANQLRDNPRPGPGKPAQYELGGNALKHYSDCRDWLRPVAPSSMKTQGKFGDAWAEGGYLETSVDPAITEKDKNQKDPSDLYQYVYFTNKKNKLTTPYGRAEIRIWARDRYGVGHGICPVFDTWHFLNKTENASIYGGHITCEKFFPNSKPTWKDFKSLILSQERGDTEEEKKMLRKLKMPKRVNVRKECFKMMKEMTT